jgi:hypothetical protein
MVTPRATNLEVLDRSRVYLWDTALDRMVAELGRDAYAQGPCLLATLIMCHGVFDGSAALYVALERAWPCWRGRRANIRPVYARLKPPLSDTPFFLMGEGFYGFMLRASPEQRAEEILRRDQRLARAAATRVERALDDELTAG